MLKRPVTSESVAEAADSLLAEGKNPTMNAVREVLGGGSLSTISPLLREWRDQKGQQAAAVIELPDEIRTVIERACTSLWDESNKIASRRVLAAEDRLKEFEINANREQKTLEAELALLEKTNAELVQKIEAQAGMLGDRDKIIHDLELEVTRLRAQADTQSLFHEQMRAMTDRFEKIEKQISAKS